jgi:hypothetical protein
MPDDKTQLTAFSRLYGELLDQFAGQVGEKEPPYGGTRGPASRSVREEIVRCVWFGGHFRREGLCTDDGRRIEILSPGWWNVEAGPDFRRAEFLIEGEGRLTGDVEIHTVASAWYAHGHHLQADYNDVALHVVMWNDREFATVAAESGRQIPQLTLSLAVDEDIEDLAEALDPEEESADEVWPPVEGKYCSQAYAAGEIDAAWLGRLLDVAGDYRILNRAREASELFEVQPRDQVLYSRIAEALGYKNNRLPFLQLAGLLPMDALRAAVPPEADAPEKSTILEAAFFTVGGLIECGDGADCDPETVAYCTSLHDAWVEYCGNLDAAGLARDQWSLSGARPVNYPTRRLAALAKLCSQHLHSGLFRHFLHLAHATQPEGRQRDDTALRAALMDAFRQLEHPYWSYRYTFSGRRLARSRALVGDERATSIVVDVLLPILLGHAQRDGDAVLQSRLCGLWRGLPRRQGNAVTRRMEQAIFPNKADAQRVVNCARRQQGLHQLYRDCCNAEEGCGRCVLYLAHHSGHTLTAPGAPA